ncbi:MAG: DUF805 domain-containing protein [Pseudomonadota bacterium]
MKDMFRPLRHYADFGGRARRREYWLFILLSWLLLAPIAAAGYALGWHPLDASGEVQLLPRTGATMADKATTAALVAAALLLAAPWLAVQTRRFHDTGRSAWMLVWNLVPTIGWLVVFYYMVIPGTEGPNRYGRDPTEEVDDWGRVIG